MILEVTFFGVATDFVATIAGAVLGVVGTLWFIPRYFPPKIAISSQIAKSEKNGVFHYRIKIINRTTRPIFNVSAELQFIYRLVGKDYDITKSIPLLRSDILAIAKYDKSDMTEFDYWYVFLVKKGEDDDLQQLFENPKYLNPRLRFRIIATHSISNHTYPFTQPYTKDSFLFGHFQTGDSCKINID